jgi:hypothetical protein
MLSLTKNEWPLLWVSQEKSENFEKCDAHYCRHYIFEMLQHFYALQWKPLATLGNLSHCLPNVARLPGGWQRSEVGSEEIWAIEEMKSDLLGHL